MGRVTEAQLYAAAMGTALDAPKVAGPYVPYDRKQDRRIYFIRVEAEDRPIKIGIAWDLARRLSNLQTASPFPITYLGDYPGTEDDERDVHRRFAHLRIRGEWFRSEPDLLGFIDRNIMRGV